MDGHMTIDPRYGHFPRGDDDYELPFPPPKLFDDTPIQKMMEDMAEQIGKKAQELAEKYPGVTFELVTRDKMIIDDDGNAKMELITEFVPVGI